MVGDRTILEQILAILPNNLFLEYIIRRVQREDYRGLHVSQHNRYDLDRLIKILRGIYFIVGLEKFRIPLGDDIGEREPDCGFYYAIVTEVNKRAGIGTINSLKKNFFVDFERMGLMYRYDKNGNKIINIGRGQVYYGQLTDRVRDLLEGDIIKKYRIFTDSIDILFRDEIANIANTLYYSHYKNARISIDEFMLILSDSKPEYRDKKIDLLDSFRSLNRLQQEHAIDLIQKYCDPNSFSGDKTQRRDYHNWKNESQQIFSLLKNTVYFDITKNSLKLNTGMYGIFTDTQIKQRTLGAKRDYFVKHNLLILTSYELHHIVPFSAARNKEEFKLIDHWGNLIYLTSNKHAEFSNRRNRNIILLTSGGSLIFEDFDKNVITAKNGITARYSEGLTTKMLGHNKGLLKVVYGYPVKS